MNSPIAFISRSNCEYELSGNALKSSSRSSFGSIGDVGGVEKGFDWTDDREGVDEPFVGLDWTGPLFSVMDPAECGR